ncbi:MAG: hypothetical protein KME06_05075 [Kastovskya adunca ATA6-11-RM4]|jgi:hypothetical protein|nr:hypothetical protein [Kastovskya adunca ATA6-11-RM4]
MNLPDIPSPFKQCIQDVSENLRADVLLFSADIDYESADVLIELIRGVKNRRENVALVLSTYGGDPDAAYRITRILQDKYKKFFLLVFGFCKSAGTLIALGADEIVMSDFAELGPLDVQVYRDDDFRRSSGLDIQQALNVLSIQVFEVFETSFLSTINRGSGVITTKTAADIASSMAVGLLAPISSQIDPLRLGEMNRVMSIAHEYGKRLNPTKPETINKLVSGYPSHSFVIDYEEAKELFEVVRRPNDCEQQLERFFSKATRASGSQMLISDLTAWLDPAFDEGLEGENHGSENTGIENPSGTDQGNSRENGEVQRNSILTGADNEAQEE